jgi:hypothetical protein
VVGTLAVAVGTVVVVASTVVVVVATAVVVVVGAAVVVVVAGAVVVVVAAAGSGVHLIWSLQLAPSAAATTTESPLPSGHEPV